MEGNRRRKEEGTFRKWNRWEVCQENGPFGKSLVEIIPYLNRFNGVEEPRGQRIPIGMTMQFSEKVFQSSLDAGRRQQSPVSETGLCFS